MSSCIADDDFDEELTCPMCLDSWRHPVELIPCGHIFCTECSLQGEEVMKQCPICRADVTTSQTPHRTLVNMALRIPVTCSLCQWKGSREASYTHNCASPADAKTVKDSKCSPSSSASPGDAEPNPVGVNGTSDQQNSSGLSTLSSANEGLSFWMGTSSQPSFPHNENASSDSNRLTSTPFMNGQVCLPGFNVSDLSDFVFSEPEAKGDVLLSPEGTDSLTYGFASAPDQRPSTSTPQRRPALSGGDNRGVVRATGPRPWENYGMSESEYNQVTQFFDRLDKKRKGYLDLPKATRLARWLNLAQTIGQVSAFIKEVDTNEDGLLTREELLTWIKRNPSNPERRYGLSRKEYSHMMAQFHLFDKDQDGWLQLEDFCAFGMATREFRSVARAQRAFEEMDTLEGGRVDLHTFLVYRAARKRGETDEAISLDGSSELSSPSSRKRDASPTNAATGSGPKSAPLALSNTEARQGNRLWLQLGHLGRKLTKDSTNTHDRINRQRRRRPKAAAPYPCEPKSYPIQQRRLSESQSSNGDVASPTTLNRLGANLFSVRRKVQSTYRNYDTLFAASEGPSVSPCKYYAHPPTPRFVTSRAQGTSAGDSIPSPELEYSFTDLTYF